MLEHLMQYRIVRIAKAFGVSRCGLYYWIDNRHKVTTRNEHEALELGREVCP
jgi:transposase-like protein